MRTLALLALVACHPYTWSGLDRDRVRCGAPDQSGTLVRCSGGERDYICVREVRGSHWECFPLTEEHRDAK